MACLFQYLGVTFRLSLGLQKRCVRHLQQPPYKRSPAGVGRQLVPGVQKAVLGQVIRRIRVRRQFTQEISDLRLVPADELAKRCGVLCRYDACNKLVIFGVRRMRGRVDQSRPAYRHMMKYAMPIANGNAAPERQPRNA